MQESEIEEIKIPQKLLQIINQFLDVEKDDIKKLMLFINLNSDLRLGLNSDLGLGSDLNFTQEEKDLIKKLTADADEQYKSNSRYIDFLLEEMTLIDYLDLDIYLPESENTNKKKLLKEKYDSFTNTNSWDLELTLNNAFNIKYLKLHPGVEKQKSYLILPDCDINCNFMKGRDGLRKVSKDEGCKTNLEILSIYKQEPESTEEKKDVKETQGGKKYKKNKSKKKYIK